MLYYLKREPKRCTYAQSLFRDQCMHHTACAQREWRSERLALTSLTVSFSLILARSSCTPAASTAVLDFALSCADGFCTA